jgi:peptide/nickel transport system permease protein
MSLLKQLVRAPLSAKFGLLVIVVYILVALFAPVLAPFGETQVVGEGFAPWGGEFLLGTDNLGRDMFSRLVYGARNTLGIAFLTTVLAFLLGGLSGLVAAIKGGGSIRGCRGWWTS